MFNLDISTKELNLADKAEREAYSQKLQEMESEFTYPLAENVFSIQHGNFKDQDYFAFFEQMGKPSFFVFEKDNEVIGCFCTILREIKGQKVWYFCDYKIKKEYRGRKLYRKLILKYLPAKYLISNKMFGISMSPVWNNWLFKAHQGFFDFFHIRQKKMFLHTFTYGDYVRDKAKLTRYKLVSNHNKKDIVINGHKKNILHLCHEGHTYGFTVIDHYVDFPEDTPVMLLNEYPMPVIYNEKTQEISLITNLDMTFHISSAEV